MTVSFRTGTGGTSNGKSRVPPDKNDRLVEIWNPGNLARLQVSWLPDRQPPPLPILDARRSRNAGGVAEPVSSRFERPGNPDAMRHTSSRYTTRPACDISSALIEF